MINHRLEMVWLRILNMNLANQSQFGIAGNMIFDKYCNEITVTVTEIHASVVECVGPSAELRRHVRKSWRFGVKVSVGSRKARAGGLSLPAT